MLTTCLLLLVGGIRIPIVQDVVPQRPPVHPLFDSPATAWISPINDSTDERQMLWDAQYVLYYAGRRTSDPLVNGSRIEMIFGARIRERLTQGWYSFDPPRSIESADLSLAIQPSTERSDRPVVIVLDERDYADVEGSQAVMDKLAELNKTGIKEAVVLQRSATNTYFSFPVLRSSSTMMLYWIGDDELSLLFRRDFTFMVVAANALTLEVPNERVLAGKVTAYSFGTKEGLCLSSQTSVTFTR